MSDIIGWELIYKNAETELKKKEDVLTLLIHFVLIKAGYKCIGLGDDKLLNGNEVISELLPAGWNSSSSYSVRYILKDSLFILRGVPVDDNIVYNFLNVENLGVTNVAFNINGTVENCRGNIELLFKNKSADVINKIRAELLNTGPQKNVSTQTTPSVSTSLNCMRGVEVSTNTTPPITPPTPFQIPRPPGFQNEPFWVDPDTDPLRVGRSDLEPFGGGGGGMIFNPFRGPRGGIGPDPGAGIPGGLPRGGIPPGARFDPFGPPPTGSRPRPRQPPPDADDFSSWYM